MKSPFSIRHSRLIEENKLKLNLTKTQKMKFLYLLQDYNDSWYETTETGWNYSITIFEKVNSDLLKTYGFKTLKAYVNDQFIDVNNIDDFVLGTKPEYILDTIELFYDRIIETEKRQNFALELNQILNAEQLSIRFMESEIVRLDSESAESEILFKVNRLLKEESFDKAHYDFIEARQRLSNGDYSGCIISANNALESFLKKLLDNRNDNQGTLKKLLIKSKLIPDYFNGFLDYFEGLLQSSFTIANKSARHGQKDIPDEINKVDESIACFCLNLVGTLIIFISERYIAIKPQLEKSFDEIQKKDTNYEDDLPF
jgi:hypothetical protein